MSTGATTAKIRARGADGTGITDEVAKAMFLNMGGTTIAIVELEHVRQINESSGDHKVELTIGFIEPATSDRMEDVLRTLARGTYRSRSGQVLPGTEDGGEVGVDDALTQAEALIERGEDGRPTGVWDGDTETDAPTGDGVNPMEEHALVPSDIDPARCAVDGCGKTNRAKVHIVTSSPGLRSV